MSEFAERTALSDLLARMRPEGDTFRVDVPDDWLQGRAMYGGLSTALCLQAAYNGIAALPPLRSAQVSFVGPAGGTVRVSPVIVRRGKSTVFVAVDLTGDKGLATRAMFCFAAARESRLAEVHLPAPGVAPPAECGPFFEDGNGRNQGPSFAQHFESRRAGGALPVSGAARAEFLAWMQHRDEPVEPAVVALVALADTLPPAAMACFTEPAPVSSMTWLFDVLRDDLTGGDGWWLCRSTADAIEHGYCSQAMTIWDTACEPVLVGRQNVAVFY